MTEWLWAALLLQIAMGGFDTLYHHEGSERLAWRPSQQRELRLHGVRNLAYSVMFITLGFTQPMGIWASMLIILMLVELVITLWDFVEEDRTRKLPATERVTHTLLTLNYGVVLAMLIPLLRGWAEQPSVLMPTYYGIFSWLCLLASIGVVIFGFRDLAAAHRAPRLQMRDAKPLAAALTGRKAILITGGTGFIGKRLVAALIAAGHDVTVLTRSAVKAIELGAPIRVVTSLTQIADDTQLDAIINLAGDPISDTPWTLKKRRRILRSRLHVTRDVIALIDRLARKPSVLVSGSAIGYYGLRGDDVLTEQSGGKPCFSMRICVAWENAAKIAEKSGVRTVLLRTGLVLDTEGGMLAKMLTPFEFGLGGRFGNGHHYMSWIHRDDLIRLVIHAIATPNLRGPVNATAPHPVTNNAFTYALGNALGRIAIIPVPAAPLRFALGDFAEELLLNGQNVYPEVAIESNFQFEFATIDTALCAIVGKPRGIGIKGNRNRTPRLKLAHPSGT